MKTKAILVFILALLVSTGQATAANYCSDLVVDEPGLLSAEGKSQVLDAATKLKSAGVDVRVQILSNTHGQPTLVALKDNFISKCGSWRAKDNPKGMKNDLVVLMVSTNPKLIGTYYGDGLANKLSSRESVIQADMASHFREGNIAAGLTAGLRDVSDLASVKAHQVGAPVTIADYSGLWTVLKWLLAIAALALIVWSIMKYRKSVEIRRAAQRDAKTERARCTAAINGFESPHAILASRIKTSSASDAKKARLLESLANAKSDFDHAAAEFSAIDRSANDPETTGLSAEEYGGMAKRYSTLASRFTSAFGQLDRIESDLKRPETTQQAEASDTSATFRPRPSVHKDTARASGSSRTTGSFGNGGQAGQSRHVQEEESVRQPAGTTTIVNNTTVQQDDNLLLGILIGQATSEHHHHDAYRAEPTRYEPPAPAYEPRVEKSSSGTGTEEAWGISSSGGGSESSWASPDPVRTADPDPDPEPAGGGGGDGGGSDDDS